MEYPTGIIDSILAAAAGAIGWFARVLWAGVQEVKGDLARFQVKVAEEYTPTARFNSAMQNVDSKLDRILDKLERKADRDLPL